ncbi:hypothetical protein CONLIGDRAFT_639273 [Coniochaeta ligniaria NRRL 30616]|uniref:C2H2-type domain-containing protein n=1 Tax=Coniochaeta ligniaria NRRL 30616 TaxID=1408157 RepID=A0A1J7J6F0_9PEZI|nr:hypothetical protein CONLIGDRAFT_639273 [Coniochaeta ligniaria NRRL 30616]
MNQLPEASDVSGLDRTHPYTKEKPYACQCGSSFTRRDLLRRHERLVHEPAAPANVHDDIPSIQHSIQAEIMVSTVGASSDADNRSSQISISSGRTLPLPPEYHHIYSTLRDQPSKNNPLHDFTAFIDNSGLRQLAHPPEVANLRHIASHSERDSVSVSDIVEANQSPSSQLERSEVRTSCLCKRVFVVQIDPTKLRAWLMGAHYPILVVSDYMLQPYLGQLGDFTVPPTQSIERYYKAYMENGRFQVIHPSLSPVNFHISLKLAILALGAQLLFENRNATSLFRASRSITLELWTSQDNIQQGTPQKFQLASAFLLLTDFVKEKTNHLHFPSSSVFCRAGSYAPWDIMKLPHLMRTEVFGLCVALIQTVLFQSLPGVLNIAQHIRFPCSPDAWNLRSPEEFATALHTPAGCFPQADEIHEVFETFFEGTMPRTTGLTLPTLYILVTLLTQRVIPPRELTSPNHYSIKENTCSQQVE